MSKLSKNDECLILFRLNTPCVELHTQSVAISNIKIVIFNNSDIEALEKVLLPRFFKEKFEKMELKSQDENNGEDKKTKTKSKKSLNVKKTKSSLKTIDKKASSGISCLNTQLRDDKKPTKELRKSTETDKNQKDIPCKSIIRFPKIAVKGNQLRGNTFKGKRNNTFDNVFEADFENLPHAKKINKLSLTCNLKNSNVKDTFNNPILSLTQDKSTARYKSLTDNQYHKEKGSRTRQTSSKTKAQRTLSRKAIEDELPSSKLTLSYSENGIKSSEVLKNTSNPMADEGTLDNKLNDLKTLRDKYEQLKPAASEGNLTGFTDKMKSNNDFKVIDDVIEISADDDDLININIDSRNAVLKGRNVLLKSDESLNNTLSHIAEEDSFEIKISNLKILRHQSQQLKHVTSVGNLFGFTDNLKSNKCLNVIDDIIEISDNDDDVIENNVSIDSRNVVRKRRNVLLKCDESLNTTLNHKAKEDSFENKVSNLKILRHRSQQFKHVASEGNLFGFTDKLKSNKAFNVIDDIIEIKDNDENIIENVNIDSPNVVEKNVLFKSESLKTRLDHVEKEDLFENKVVNLKTLRHQSQQLKHVECEGNLFGFTERLKLNKNFNAIDNIIEISDDEDNNLVENNANIGSQIIIRKARNALIQTESSKTKSNDTVEQNLLENNLFSLKTTGHYSQLETPIKLDRSVFDSGLLTNASNNKIISQGVIENSVNVSSPSTNIESASTAQIKKTFENSFSQNVSDEDSSLPIIAVCTPKQVLRLSKLLNKKSKKLEEKAIQDIEVFKSKSTLENRCKFEFDRIDEGIYERKHEKVISRKEESERAQEVDCELKFRNCLEEIRNAKLSVCKKLSKVDENLSDNSASSLLNISATSIYSANNVDKGFNVRNDEDSQTLTKTVTVTPIKTQAPLLNPTFVNKQLIDTIHKISFCHKRDYAELEKDENFTSENTFSDSLLSESLSCYSRHDTIASKESARMENDFCCDNTSLNANLRSIFDNNSSSDLQDTRNINLVSKLTSRKNELEFHNDASSNISTIINNAVKDTEVVLNDNSTEKKNLKHSQELLQELYSQSLFSSIEENQISQTNSITNEVLANSCLSNTKICNNSLKFFEDTVLQVPNNENDINLDTQNNQQSPTIKLKTNSNVQKEILFGNNKEFVKEAVSNVNMLPDVITNARSLNTEINECVEYDFIPETPLKETITTEKIILYPIPIDDSFISKETVTSENQILTENLIEDHLISKITFQDTSATEKNCLTQNESKKANMVENQLSEVTTDKVETDDKLCKRVSVIIDYTTQKAVTKILQMQSIQKSVHVKSTSEINKISNLKNMTEILQLKENDQSKNITNKTAVQNKNWFSNDKTVDRIATSTFKKDINDFTKLHQTITNSFTSTHSKSSSKYSSKKIKLYNPNNPVITGNTEEPLLIDAQNSQSLQISNALTKNFKRNFEYSSTFSQSSNKPAKKMNRKNFVPNETLLSSGVKKKSKSNLFLNKTNKINTGKTKK